MLGPIISGIYRGQSHPTHPTSLCYMCLWFCPYAICSNGKGAKLTSNEITHQTLSSLANYVDLLKWSLEI